jgi:hypothetical protein
MDLGYFLNKKIYNFLEIKILLTALDLFILYLTIFNNYYDYFKNNIFINMGLGI